MQQKRLWLLLALSLLLSACEIIIEGDSGYYASDFRLFNPSYYTNFDGDVICENRTTYLSYSFEYSGRLERWTSYLEGETSGVIKGYETFDRYDRRVDYRPKYVRVTYEIPPGTAPLSEELSPQAIETSLGKSILSLRVNGDARRYQLTSKGIPVIYCDV